MNEIDIPKGWEKVKLGDLLEEYCERNDNQKYKVVAVGKYGIRKREDIYTKELSKDTSKIKIIMKDTLTIGMGSEQIDIGILIEDEKYCVSPAYTTYKIKNCNSKFLEYYMEYLNPKLSDLFMIVSARQGKSVDKEGLLRYKVMLPSIKEQEKIVEILENIDFIINRHKKLLEEKNQFIKSLFANMFGKGNCELKKLKDISVIKGEYGSNVAATDYNVMLPRYVRITDITDDGRLNKNSLVSPKNELYIEKYLLTYGDILFARTGATVGKTYKYVENDGRCIYAGYCIRFRVDTNIVDPEYILRYTQSDRYLKWVEIAQRGGAQPNINSKQYGNLLIPIPPMEEQNKFKTIVTLVEKQKTNLNKKIENYIILKKGLMQQLLTGKIRVKI